jgi:hypothetical protein
MILGKKKKKKKKSQNNNSMKTEEIRQKTEGLTNHKARSIMQPRKLRVMCRIISIITSKQPHGLSRGVTCQRKGCPVYCFVGLPLHCLPVRHHHDMF